MIYLTAVLPARSPEESPYVATPIGPYRDDEADAIERGKTFLREAYGTRDIRTVTYGPLAVVDFVDVRAHVLRGVLEEAAKARAAYEEQRAQDALESLRDETCAWLASYNIDVSDDDLDQVLEALGVNPRDV